MNKKSVVSIFRNVIRRPKPRQFNTRMRQPNICTSDMHWERRLVGGVVHLPSREGARYEFGSAREVNDFVARLFEQGFDGTLHVNYIRLDVYKPEDSRYIVRAEATGEQVRVMSYSQTVFESGLRMLDTQGYFNLIVTANGLWSSRWDSDLEYLHGLMVTDPDFGPGGVYKSSEELRSLKLAEPMHSDEEIAELEAYLSSIDGVYDVFDKDDD